MLNKLKLASLAFLIALVAIAIMTPSTLQYMQMQADAATVGVTSVQPVEFDGRCTLVTGTPVMATSATSATTTYYTPGASGNRVTLYNGDNLVLYEFAELSNITTNAATGSAGPAAVVSGSNYDLFVWNKSGTLTFTRGPAWTNATTRAAGISAVKGIYVNGAAITNGPAINRGTFVCTEHSAADSTINWMYGNFTGGWGSASHHLWNMYNRVTVSGAMGDSTVGTHSYNSTTVRQVAGRTAPVVSAVFGLAEDGQTVTYMTRPTNGASVVAAVIGIGLDSTTTFAGVTGIGSSIALASTALTAQYSGIPGLGFHSLTFNEACSTAQTTTFFDGQTSGPPIQSGGTYQLRM